MIASNPVDYTSEARWRKDLEPDFAEPEQAGETEMAPAVDDRAGREPVRPHASRRRARKRRRNSDLPPYMGTHIDFYA